jgi:hypothetical protein
MTTTDRVLNEERAACEQPRGALENVRLFVARDVVRPKAFREISAGSATELLRFYRETMARIAEAWEDAES